jgi:cytochrome c oxidase subunit 2
MLQKILGLPIDASVHGWEIDRLLAYVHIMMALLFVGWSLLFIFMLVRFRRSRQTRAIHDGVKTHASSYVEVLVAVLEIVLLVVFSIPFWVRKVGAFPTQPDTVRLRVIAQQFAWNVHYPGPDGVFGRTDIRLVTDDNPIGLDRKAANAKDDIVTLNQLYLPVKRPAIIELTTKDVVHSFSLPLMRVKQDTIPGMMIPIHFTPMLTSDEVREREKMTVHLPPRHPITDLFIAMQDYKDAQGNTIIANGKRFSRDTADKLLAADVREVTIAPATPMEIACAQLCGLNHFRMKGFLNVLTEENFEKWYAKAVEEAKEE